MISHRFNRIPIIACSFLLSLPAMAQSGSSMDTSDSSSTTQKGASETKKQKSHNRLRKKNNRVSREAALLPGPVLLLRVVPVLKVVLGYQEEQWVHLEYPDL